MTDTLTVGNITQLVQPAGRVAWFPPLERNEFTFVVQPDPRDARIAELEAALREIVQVCEHQQLFSQNKVRAIYIAACEALVPFPEGDMNITVEELSA